MALTDEQTMQLQSALNPSIQLALPQTVMPVTKTSYETKGVRYDPAKLQALKLALTTGRSDLKPLKSAITSPRPVMSKWEAVANALAQYPESRSFTGGFGEEIINPWDVGLGSFARAFGNVYGARLASQREADAQAREDAIKAAELDYNRAEAAREDAIKAAQLENEAAKQEYAQQVADDYIKFNNPKTTDAEKALKEEEQKKAAVAALHELSDLAENGGINSLNKSTDNWGLSSKSSKNIGRREQALSTLVPMTAKVAHDAGISGINSVGEAMLYLGFPTDATSAQIKGALPGVIKKLGLEEEYYQQSPIGGGLAF